MPRGGTLWPSVADATIAVSVATNIVEGSARPSTAEYCRFLYIAHSSARECSYLIDLACRLDMIPAAVALPLTSRYDHVQGSLIKAARTLEGVKPHVSRPKASSPKPQAISPEP